VVILGIDTSTGFLCIGIYDDKLRNCEYRIDLGKRISSFILPSLKRILDNLQLEPEDIDYFAAGLGPGSFTGIRIGLSVIKGFAYALKKPVIGISSLDILALNAKQLLNPNYGILRDFKNRASGNMFSVSEVRICPIIDAKRNLVFASLYTIKDGSLKRTMPYKLISVDDLLKKLPSGVVFLGDALKLYKDRIKLKIKKAILLDQDYWYPKAENIIELARERIRLKKIDNLKTIHPLYLYPKECQIRK
jgi:tRNA threonylcarbamoyladenosine biosynthesis protein TsaB